MTDLRTVSPDELPPLSEIPDDLRVVVFSPNGPLQALPHKRLLSKLIATDLCKATKALLDADLAHAANSVALVFSDPTAALNGWYRKLGASGAGSWQQFEELARNSRVLAAAAAATAQAWAEGSVPGGAGTKSAKEHATDAGVDRIRAGFLAGFPTRAALVAVSGAVNGYTSTVTTDAGMHSAVSGEIALGGAAATVGAAIPNEGTYTRTAGAWLRTGDSEAQRAAAAGAAQTALAAAEADEAAAHALNAQNVVSAASSNGDAVFVAVRPDGWTAEVYWRGFKAGGTAAPTPDATPKLILNVVDLGYDGTGTLTTRSRAIVGTVQLRQPHPNATLPVDTVDAGGASRVFALSEPVFAKSNIGFRNSGWMPVVTMLSGLYTDNGSGGSSAPSTTRRLYAVNNSTKAYPKMVANWAISGFLRAAGTFNAELAVDNQYGFNQRPFAAVRLRLTDSAGASVLGPISTDYSASAQVPATNTPQGHALNPLVAKASVSTTGRADGLGTLDALFYPWLGDEVWDTAVEGVTWPTPQVSRLPILIDNAGNFTPAFACLDTVSGNNATAVVSTTQATAEAAPYATWAAARAAIQTFNNARGHNDHAGGVILLTQDIAGFGENLQSTIVTGLTWFTVACRSSVTARTIGITEAANTSHRNIPARIAFRDLFIRSTSDTYVFDGQDGNAAGSPVTYARFERCLLSASAPTNFTPLLYEVGLIDKIACTMTNCGRADFQRFSINRQMHRLHLGVLDTNTGTVGRTFSVWTAVGCYYENANPSDSTAAANPNISTSDGLIHQNCHFMKMRATAFYSNQRASVRGIVLAQNVYEFVSTVSPALSVSADSVTLEAANVIRRFNTVVGGRTNFLYNDSGTAAVAKQGVSQYCLDHEYNIKRDPFTPASGNRTGNWEVSHGVGCFGNHAVIGASGFDTGGSATVTGPFSWLGEHRGLGSTHGTAVTYTSNRSAIGGDSVGGGNYLPTGTVTVLQNKVASGRQPYPSDIRGTARSNTGTGSCGAYAL